MLVKKWDNKKDIVITNKTPMFPIDKAKKYEIGAFCVNTEKGIFYQKKYRGNHCIVHVTKDQEQIIFNKAFVSASNQEYTSIIVFDEKSKENYLIDTRGELYQLPHKESALFLGPCQYGFTLNKMTGCYKIADRDITLWELSAMTQAEISRYHKETSPDASISINKEFIEFFRKKLFKRNDDYRYLYYTCGNNKTGEIVSWLMRHSLPFEIVPNIFENDETQNIRIKLDEKNLELKAVCYLFSRLRGSYSIFGVPMDMFISIMDITETQKHKYFSALPSLTDSQEKMCHCLLNTMKMLTGIKTDNEIFNNIFCKIFSTAYFKGTYGGYGSSECSFSNNIDLWFLQETLQKEKDKFQEYESSLLAEMKLAGVKISKWANETAMFELIHKHYPDAIYQYRTKWLGQQSLDVYIPSLKIAFEYQGIQHFGPVDYFGGEEKFKELQERDLRKSNLCKKNGVHIIYWNYDEPVTERIFNQKME